MTEIERNERYNKYVEAKIAKTHAWPSLFNAFWIGGLICVIGQIFNDLLLIWFPTMATQSAWTLTLIFLIFLASFLTGINVFSAFLFLLTESESFELRDFGVFPIFWMILKKKKMHLHHAQ